MGRPRVEAGRRELNAEVAAANVLIAEGHVAEAEADAAAAHVEDFRDELGVRRLRVRCPGIAMLKDVIAGVRGTLEAVEVGGRFAFLAIRRGSGTSVSACVSAAGSPGGRASILGFEIAIDRATDDGGELSIALLDSAPLDVEPARAAGEAIGSRFTGIIERVDERFVYRASTAD
jgi:hypothetical protein